MQLTITLLSHIEFKKTGNIYFATLVLNTTCEYVIRLYCTNY